MFQPINNLPTPSYSAATNIFIHGNEEQSQLAKELRVLWGQNQELKEQLNAGSRGKDTFHRRGTASDRLTG